MTSLTTWFIKYSRFVLAALIIIAIVTPIVLSYKTKITLDQCMLSVLGITMGDSPVQFRELLTNKGLNPDEYSAYISWLFVPRFLGWLIIPTIVGIIVSEAQQSIEQQKRELAEVEVQLRRNIEQQFMEIQPTLDRGSAQQFANDVLSQIEQRLPSAKESRIDKLRRRIRRIFN